MNTQVLIDNAKDWIKYVEFGGMVVVMLFVGVFLGEIASEDIHRISRMGNIIATGACGTLALATLYYTTFDRRHSRQILLFTTLAILSVANGLKMFDLFTTPVYDIMFAAASVITLLYLLVGAIQGSLHLPPCKGGTYDHNQCRPSPLSDRRQS